MDLSQSAGTQAGTGDAARPHAALMNEAIEGCLVTGYERRGLRVSAGPGDRHVLATFAVHCGADTIVTLNLKDFSWHGVEPVWREGVASG